jgi:hypothetical protein
MARASAGVIDGIEYPATPLLLDRVPKKHNILIGNDPMQIRFAEQFLSIAHEYKVEHEKVETVNDSMVLGLDTPKLYLVERSSFIDLSPNVKAKVGIWSLDLIEKGSAGLNCIVRFGAKLMGLDKPDKTMVQRVADEMAREGVYDIRAAVWHAAWLLTSPPGRSVKWMRPWENWLQWLPKGEDARKRLHSLYWELVMWVFATSGDERGFKRTKGRWDAKMFQRLSMLQLPKDKVYNTLLELSTWRERGYDPYVCVLKVAKIWETK